MFKDFFVPLHRNLIENRKYNSAFLIYIKNRENHFRVVLLFAICGVRLVLRTFVSILLLAFIDIDECATTAIVPTVLGKFQSPDIQSQTASFGGHSSLQIQKVITMD